MSDLRPGDRVELVSNPRFRYCVVERFGVVERILADEWDGYAVVAFSNGDRSYVDIRDLRRVEATP